MLKAVITNGLPERSAPPPEIESNVGISSSPPQTKLNFLEKLLKWLLNQNIDENLKAQLYQDALSKATALNNSIQSGNLPEEPDISFLKKEYFVFKKRLEDLTKSSPQQVETTFHPKSAPHTLPKRPSFVSNKYKHFSVINPKKVKTKKSSQTKEEPVQW